MQPVQSTCVFIRRGQPAGCGCLFLVWARLTRWITPHKHFGCWVTVCLTHASQQRQAARQTNTQTASTLISQARKKERKKAEKLISCMPRTLSDETNAADSILPLDYLQLKFIYLISLSFFVLHFHHHPPKKEKRKERTRRKTLSGKWGGCHFNTCW